jgi:hypothetical protein
MLAERGEQQWAVVLNPKVALVLYKIAQTSNAVIQRIWGLEVLFVEPLLVSAPDRWVYYRALTLHTEEEINGGLLVRIFGYESKTFLRDIKG